MRRLVTTLMGAGALALASPTLAQDSAGEDDPMAAMGDLFGGMFEAEPLTAEQEARLPLARSVVERAMPEGIMSDMMGDMFDGFLGPIMKMAGETTALDAAGRLGLPTDRLDEDEAAEAMAMLDPDWRVREVRRAEAMPQIIGTAMAAMEPTVRDAMTEMYAVYFDEQVLADVGQFLDTPSGSEYIRKSFTMSADPRFMGAMMEAMPAMMGTFMTIEAQLDEATADLAEARSFDDLSDSQRRRLSALTGQDADTLRSALDAAAERGSMGGGMFGAGEDWDEDWETEAE